jgi:fatty acid desaturase
MPASASFSARDILELVKDYMEPNPLIYWTDFLLSITVGFVAFVLYLRAELFSWQQVVCFLVAGFALYRSAMFSHEVQHLKSGTFRAFRVTWNILCGIPLMVPSFLYDDHKAHHVNHSYGTPADSEYFPMGAKPFRWIVVFLLASFLLPILGPIRFLLIAPVRWLIPPLRPLIWRSASSLSIINPYYHRDPPSDAERRESLWQEIGCFCVAWTVVGLVLFGVLPWTVAPKWYVLFFFWITVNHVRALSSHRYLNPGEPMTYGGQLLDSTTIPGWLLTELWAPLGERYHALHHLVPSMPYHELGKAHRRLMKDLPADSPYRETVFPNIFAALFALFRAALASTNANGIPVQQI